MFSLNLVRRTSNSLLHTTHKLRLIYLIHTKSFNNYSIQQLASLIVSLHTYKLLHMEIGIEVRFKLVYTPNRMQRPRS